MNIGFDASDLCTNRADGTTRYTWELAKRLPQLAPQHQWEFFAPCDHPPAETAGPLLLKGGQVKWIRSPWPKYWTQTRLPFDLFKSKPDVLFMPIQQIPYFRPKMKTVAVVHDLAFHKYPEQFMYKDWLLLHTFTAHVARVADAIICVSKSTANDVAHYYGRTKNIYVVHHGVDHERFHIPTEEEKREAWKKLSAAYPALRQPYILFVGQIQPRKNLVRLVEAFERLAPTQLVIAGSHGWLNKPIYERIKKSVRLDDTVLTGRVPDDLLPALYWHAEVFVLPSLYEGFGMPILEAMAAGTPVVTSDVSSMPEIVGDAAILVDPHSVDSITQGIEQARGRREELGRKGIEQAKKFDWDQCTKQTLDIISQV